MIEANYLDKEKEMRDIKLRVEYENKADNTQMFTEKPIWPVKYSDRVRMKDKIWYPNIEPGRWLAMYPTFKEDLPLHCICGKEIHEVAPFVTAYSLGISTGKCDCGVKDAATVSKPRNKKLASYLVQLVADLAR